MNNNWNYRSNNTKSIKRGGLKKIRQKKRGLRPVCKQNLKRKVWYLCVICMCLHVCVLLCNGTKGPQESGTAVTSQGRFLQVVEVGQSRPGGSAEAVAILAALDAHLLGVGVALRAAQGSWVPAGLQRWRVGGLPALQLRGADPRVTPALGEATLRGRRVGQRLVAHVGWGRLVGGRRREVQQFAQGLEWLALTGEGTDTGLKTKCIFRYFLTAWDSQVSASRTTSPAANPCPARVPDRALGSCRGSCGGCSGGRMTGKTSAWQCPRPHPRPWQLLSGGEVGKY